jgi:hypothetical protein
MDRFGEDGMVGKDSIERAGDILGSVESGGGREAGDSVEGGEAGDSVGLGDSVDSGDGDSVERGERGGVWSRLEDG